MIDSMWDQRFAETGYYYGTEPNDFLRDHCSAIAAGGAVLCLGEGEGRNAVFLAGRGYQVVALDQSSVGLEKAKRLAGSRGLRIETVVADLDGYLIEPGRWDGIVSIWCHLPSALRPALYRQVITGLRPAGAFLLEAYTPDQLHHGTGGPKSVDLLPTLAELKRELAGLDLCHAAERERVIEEGKGHAGLSAVVQIGARRRS